MAAWIFYFPAILVLYIITKHLLNKIHNLPPSPFLCPPIISHLFLLKQPIHRTFFNLSTQLGPVFLLQLGSRKVIVVSSPSAAEECLTKNDIVFANRPPLAIGKHFGYNWTNLVWSPYGDHWRNLRRIVSLELLSTHRLRMLHNIRQDELRILLRRLRDNSQKNHQQAVNLRTAFFELTLNIIMRMMAGNRYYGENVSDLEEAKRFRDIHDETFKLGGTPNVGDFVPWIKARGLEKRMIECTKKRDEFIQCLIEEQRRKMEIDSATSGETKKNMIQVLLWLQEAEPDYYTDEIIKGLMMVLLLGATDTTVNHMEWTLALLINHPEVMKKAQMEIEASIGHDHLIEETDVVHVPYLRCIMNESLRTCPPAPLLIPHESSAECAVGGFHIPSGTMLFVNIWAIQNDPKIWDNPTEFRPERFEGLEGARDGFRSMAFGFGRRSCPGEGKALRVAGSTLGSLIQCFEWGTADGRMVDMSEGTGLSLPKAKPLNVVRRPQPNMMGHLSQL